MVLLLLREGTLVLFDNMGNVRTRLPVSPGLDKVEVAGTLALWPTAGGLQAQDFYTGVRQLWPWPVEVTEMLTKMASNTPAQKNGLTTPAIWPSLMVVSGRRLWVVQGKELSIFALD